MRSDIAPLVMQKVVIDAEQTALGVNRRTNAMPLLARVIGRHQVLAAIFQPLDRSSEAHRRDKNEYILRIDLSAHAEAAADMSFVKMKRGRAAAEHAGKRLPIFVRHLSGAMQLEYIARSVITTDSTARFEGDAGMTADR